MTYCHCHASQASQELLVAQKETEELMRFVVRLRDRGASDIHIRSLVLSLLSSLKLTSAVNEGVTVSEACKLCRLTAEEESFRAIDLIEEWWGDTPLAEVSDARIRDFQAYLVRAGVHPLFAGVVRSTLRSLFNIAADAGVQLDIPSMLVGAGRWVLPAFDGETTVGVACSEFCKKPEYGTRAHSAASEIAIYWRDTLLTQVDGRKVKEYIAWLQTHTLFGAYQIRVRLEYFRSILALQNVALPAEGEAFIDSEKDRPGRAPAVLRELIRSASNKRFAGAFGQKDSQSSRGSSRVETNT